MKKILSIAILLLGFSPALAFAANSVVATPTSGQNGLTTLTNPTASTNCVLWIFAPNTSTYTANWTIVSGGDSGNQSTPGGEIYHKNFCGWGLNPSPINFSIGGTNYGTYTFLTANASAGISNPVNLADAESQAGVGNYALATYNYLAPPTGCDTLKPLATTTSQFNNQVAIAEVGFNSAFHVSPASVVCWTGDNLIKPFIGTGVALVYRARYWLVAFPIIGGAVYFLL